jgi:hypothetical protein
VHGVLIEGTPTAHLFTAEPETATQYIQRRRLDRREGAGPVRSFTHANA